jgi:hypothetical protein
MVLIVSPKALISPSNNPFNDVSVRAVGLGDTNACDGALRTAKTVANTWMERIVLGGDLSSEINKLESD